MREACEYAKYFIKNGADSVPNTFDGNMKIQKLLVLSDFTSIIEYGEPLFNDEILAFKNGCVVEPVRQRYKNDYLNLKRESEQYVPNYTQQEQYVLDMVLGIFGKASAVELSEINHSFEFWKQAYENGTDPITGYHNKKKSVVQDMLAYPDDVERMNTVLMNYKNSCVVPEKIEVINGVTYHFDPDFDITDEVTDVLEGFSVQAEELDYTVYYDGKELVVY